MRQTFNFFVTMLLLSTRGISSLASPVLDKDIRSVQDMSMRSADTCADPSLARVYYEGYAASNTVHLLRLHEAFVSADSAEGPTAAAGWTFQGPVFKAWATQQPFTVPLFRLATSTSSDVVFATGVDAQTPPVVKGFEGPIIIAWVYNTTVCDSVPLFSAVLTSQTDHYWTTDADEHAGLLALGSGWTDGGIVAYVLPLAPL